MQYQVTHVNPQERSFIVREEGQPLMLVVLTQEGGAQTFPKGNSNFPKSLKGFKSATEFVQQDLVPKDLCKAEEDLAYPAVCCLICQMTRFIDGSWRK